jgi:hypothetical protein
LALRGDSDIAEPGLPVSRESRVRAGTPTLRLRLGLAGGLVRLLRVLRVISQPL